MACRAFWTVEFGCSMLTCPRMRRSGLHCCLQMEKASRPRTRPCRYVRPRHQLIIRLSRHQGLKAGRLLDFVDAAK